MGYVYLVFDEVVLMSGFNWYNLYLMICILVFVCNVVLMLYLLVV